MGKSPVKWIKTLLFGKKATRSNSTKGRNASKAGTDKGYNIAKGPPASAENSPVISEPVPVSIQSNGVNPESEKGDSPNRPDAPFVLPPSLGPENQGIEGPATSNDPEKFREEEAAIKAQAIFRGFLARRAFRALKGIIRLQAFLRGHLVRRQAVVTLHSTLGVIKLQALLRGKRVRSSGLGLEVNSKLGQGKDEAPRPLDSKKEKVYSNAFVCKLLSSSVVIMPLQIQYDQEEPNSVISWMQRWTFSRFWKLPSQLKKPLDSKSQTKMASYAMETESGRSKRGFRKNSPVNVDTSQPEKPKRNPRKVTSSKDPVQDNPQSELEKVKRNLRKVSSSYAETFERPENKINAQSHNVKKWVDSSNDTQEQSIDDLLEKANKDIALSPEPIPEIEISSKSILAEGPVNPVVDNPPADESNPLPSIAKEENEDISVMNVDSSVKEEQTCNVNAKNTKRRDFFSAKSEYAENGLQNSPSLPSYMQATESAKAKLRGQNSPRLGSDSAEKHGVTRRHSLPLSTNGKMTSHSPRAQKLLQASVKGIFKSDRSFLSSQDANEKPIHVEWRR